MEPARIQVFLWPQCVWPELVRTLPQKPRRDVPTKVPPLSGRSEFGEYAVRLRSIGRSIIFRRFGRASRSQARMLSDLPRLSQPKSAISGLAPN